MLKVIHLASDEKFIDRGISYFREDCRISNSVLIVSDMPDNEHVMSNADYRFNKKQDNEIYEATSGYDVIILHSLHRVFYKAIAFNSHKFIVWIGMGFDYYDLIYETKYHLMMNETKEFYMNEISEVDREILQEQISKITIPKEKLEIIKHIDVFSPVLSCEYDLLKTKNIELPNYLPWNYIYEDLEDIFSERQFSKNRSIVVGNSSDPSNNHIDIIKILDRIALSSEEKIIVPLSYGNRKYAGKVEKVFIDKYGEKFVPLKDYMDIIDYTNMLEKANTCIMAHKRQQGMGNIIMMLRLGYKIFMNEQSPAYRFLIENGIKLFTLNDINKMKDNITLPLDDDSRVQNSIIIKDLFSANRNRSRTKKMVDEMIDFHKNKVIATSTPHTTAR